MRAKKFLPGAFVAAALVTAVAGGVWAAGTHSHDGHAAGLSELKLNNGKKWQTDEPLRHGMVEMRKALASSLHAIHEGKFTPAQYDSLAGQIEKQIEFVTVNCKLPEEVDAELHVVLAEVIEGIEGMKGKADRRSSAVKVIEALDAYGKHFDHPGWEPLAH